MIEELRNLVTIQKSDYEIQRCDRRIQEIPVEVRTLEPLLDASSGEIFPRLNSHGIEITPLPPALAKAREIANFAKLIDNKTIADNDYNIAVSSYVVGEDTREVIDIKKLNVEIKGIVARQNELRTAMDEIVANIERK